MRKDRVVSEVLGESIAVTPSDLYSADFRTVFMGGYDRGQVDTLLERTADVFEMLLNQVRDLKEQIEEQKERIESFHEMESTLRNALVSSQKYGEDVIDAARRQADAILEEARLARAQASLEAAKLPGRITAEIEELQRARDRARADLLSLLDTHRGLVEEIPKAEENAFQPDEALVQSTEDEAEPDGPDGNEDGEEPEDPAHNDNR